MCHLRECSKSNCQIDSLSFDCLLKSILHFRGWDCGSVGEPLPACMRPCSIAAPSSSLHTSCWFSRSHLLPLPLLENNTWMCLPFPSFLVVLFVARHAWVPNWTACCTTVIAGLFWEHSRWKICSLEFVECVSPFVGIHLHFFSKSTLSSCQSTILYLCPHELSVPPCPDECTWPWADLQQKCSMHSQQPPHPHALHTVGTQTLFTEWMNTFHDPWF